MVLKESYCHGKKNKGGKGRNWTVGGQGHMNA